MAGHPRKPAKLKALEGNRGRRQLPDEPKPSLNVPKLPEHLNPDARVIWRTYVKQLRDCGILTEIDGHAVADLCAAEAHLIRVREERDRHGIMILDGETGGMKVNPLIKLTSDLETKVRLMRKEFGLYPMDRNKVQAVSLDQDDDMAKLIG